MALKSDKMGQTSLNVCSFLVTVTDVGPLLLSHILVTTICTIELNCAIDKSLCWGISYHTLQFNRDSATIHLNSLDLDMLELRQGFSKNSVDGGLGGPKLS